MQQTPVSHPGETTLDPVHEESSVSGKSETVEKEHETNPVTSQESQLFQKRVLKVCSYLKRSLVAAPQKHLNPGIVVHSKDHVGSYRKSTQL